MRIGEMFNHYIYLEKISYRELSKQIGVSHTTLNRFANGKSIDVRTFVKILNWLLEAGR